MSAAKEIPSILVDAIQSIGVHNGVARLTMVRLGADGSSTPTVELLVPMTQIDGLVSGLSKVRSR